MALTRYRSDRSWCGRKIGFARSALCFVEMCYIMHASMYPETLYQCTVSAERAAFSSFACLAALLCG